LALRHHPNTSLVLLSGLRARNDEREPRREDGWQMMSMDLLMPLYALLGMALASGAVVLAVGVMLLLVRDVAQTQFRDGKRNEG
jgi:hypothetical protein